MIKRQKRRSQLWRAGSYNGDAKRVEREDRILDELVVKFLALPQGHTVALSDGQMLVSLDACGILASIRAIGGRNAIGQYRIQASLNRVARKGVL